MDLEAKGRPWDRATHERIKRKGGEHFRSPCQDYIDLERKIEAHELRYADRVDVFVAGQKFSDTVVVLNGGTYMSTGIEPTEQERYDSISVTGSGRQVEDDEDTTDINPNRGVWSDPKPITAGELHESALYWLAQAEDHRRRARRWLVVAFVSTVLLVVVLAIPNEWIYLLSEAFR